jgi:hypothetical protein
MKETFGHLFDYVRHVPKTDKHFTLFFFSIEHSEGVMSYLLKVIYTVYSLARSGAIIFQSVFCEIMPSVSLINPRRKLEAVWRDHVFW